MNNSNAYDDFHKSRKIKEDYTEVIEYLNGAVFTAEDQSAEEFIFFMGNEFCKNLPDFYPYCQSFWDAYTEYYLSGVKYYLETPTLDTPGGRYKKIKNHTGNMNNHFEITDDLRQELFIEHNRQIDENLTAIKKDGTKSTKRKNANLKSI